jgi:predicted lipid carrier protein YhbT
MEGDTELGLLVKNTIDAIEFPVLDAGAASSRPMCWRSMRQRFVAPWDRANTR